MAFSRNAFLSKLLMAILILSAPSPAGSFDLNVKAVTGIDAEVGLDPETRALIARLPKEIRVQIVEAVEESLVHLDKSVLLYLSELNKVVGIAIDDAACKSAAAANNVAEAILGKLPLLGDKQEIVKKAYEDFEETQASASASDQPKAYAIAYADLLARTVVARCTVALAQEAVWQLDNLQEAVRPKWKVWARLGKTKCEDAHSCYAMLQGETSKAVREADRVDVLVVDADTRMTQVREPSTNWFRYSASEYEDQFVEMFAIIDGLGLAKKFREVSADADLAEASQMLQEAQKHLRIAKTRAAKPTNLEHLRVAARASRKAAEIAVPLKQKISNAVETLPEIQKKADPISAASEKLVLDIQKVEAKIALTREAIERVRTLGILQFR
ncbi:hypothetical protein GGI64_003895 [Rhizobium leguminosarum]|uniref:Uncharacterized protein n=1 Tax=Rhizobium leguminosarum TaxID=384 RepID=A0A7Z0E0I0_RHILE|nr:hypothetical protein [Rhizobium leguminosarum]NYJ12821.1 hypothetical protein [Rhizobium leguminosarum]